jgi:CubicO group peptidase (beta-lactamase class C family)
VSLDENHTWQHLGELVTRNMEKLKVPGVALGVLRDGETRTAGWGVTSVENPLPVTASTLFQIGSITKTFTATAIMRLVEQGRLDLEARVRAYLPGFCVQDKEASASATVRHLLTHTGGWAGDFFHGTGQGNDALARYVADMADLPQLAPIGSLWSYNNAGFGVAGLLVEKVTGRLFEDVLQDLVLEPLGLEHCYFDPAKVMTYRFAIGHDAEEQGPQVARPWMLDRYVYPVGGIATDVHDLLRYARFHLGGGPDAVLPQPVIEQMQSPQVRVWGGESWGLGWSVQDVSGAREIMHSGGTKGQVSLLVLVPERGFALAVLTNGENGGQLTQAVRRWLLRESLGLEVPVPRPVGSSGQELAEFVGHYRGYYGDVALGLLAGKLVGQRTFKRGFPNEEVPPPPAPPPMSLDLCETDRLVVLDGCFKDAPADVLRRADGSIGWLRFGGRLHVREG